jgi:hypothetical protein
MRIETVKRNSHAHRMVQMINTGVLQGKPRECADHYLRIAHPRDGSGQFTNVQRLRILHRPLYNKLLATAVTLQWGRIRVQS